MGRPGPSRIIIETAADDHKEGPDFLVARLELKEMRSMDTVLPAVGVTVISK